MKDIICREYDSNIKLGFQSEILTKSRVDFFLPVSFQVVENTGRIVAFFDVSGTDEMKMLYDGSEAPHIAIKMVRGMLDACDYYIFPSDYEIKREFMRKSKDGNIKLLYVPREAPEEIGHSYTGYIRNTVANKVRNFYPKEGIAYRELLDNTITVLKDTTLGLETCMRKLSGIRDEAYTMKAERSWSGIDFSMKIV